MPPRHISIVSSFPHHISPDQFQYSLTHILNIFIPIQISLEPLLVHNSLRLLHLEYIASLIGLIGNLKLNNNNGIAIYISVTKILKILPGKSYTT